MAHAVSPGEHWENVSALPIAALLHRVFPVLVGDVRGLDVLDVATVTGEYARMWAAAGARRVVGADRSAEMIAAARRAEERDSAGVEYHVVDPAELPSLGSFDLVTAAFVLNYAYDDATMAAMARGLYDNLRPGGRLAGVLPHPEFRFPRPGVAEHGYTYVQRGRIGIGTVVGITLHTDPPFEFEHVLADRDVYERNLAAAGFAPPRWVDLHEPHPDHRESFESLAENPPVILFETSRPA